MKRQKTNSENPRKLLRIAPPIPVGVDLHVFIGPPELGGGASVEGRRAPKQLQLFGTTEGRTEVRGTVSRGRKTLHDTQQQKARHTLWIAWWRITTKFLTAGRSQDALRGRPGRSFRAVHFGGYGLQSG